MSDTKIQWTDKVWNVVTGCSKVSAGCKNCYAEGIALEHRRNGVPGYENGFKPTFHADRLQQPYGWKKAKRIFVCSMGDLFHEDVQDERLLDVFEVIRSVHETSMHKGSRHTFIILTKRPHRMVRFFRRLKWAPVGRKLWLDDGNDDYCAEADQFKAIQMMDNVWLGVSVEDQRSADERIPLLLQIPAAVRFVSVEPMLEGITLHSIGKDSCSRCIGDGIDPEPRHPLRLGDLEPCKECTALGAINWVICGCESGPNRRPFAEDWVRSLRDQCADYAVPFFYKQGRDEHNRVVEMPTLDGETWAQFPSAAQPQGELF